MLYTFDTETRGLFGKIFRWASYDGKNITKGYSGTEAVVWLMGLSEEDHVYIHNLEFDLSKLLQEGLLIDLDHCKIINRSFAVAEVIGGPMLHCSWHIMRSSLDSLSQSFNLGGEAKMDLEEILPIYKEGKYPTKSDFFMHVDPNDELLNTYLDRDVISLYRILGEVREYSGLEEKFFRIITTPQLAMTIFRERFKPDYKALCQNRYSLEQESWFRTGYIGADTQMFVPEVYDGFHYDINSLYPYVMKSYEYPGGSFRDTSDPRMAKAVWELAHTQPHLYPHAILECNVTVPRHEKYPVLPVRTPDKLLFPVGKIHGTWTKPELDYAISRGAKITKYIRICAWRNSKDYFSRFINWCMDGKINSEGGKRQFFKDLQNSSYGKIGMNRIRESYYYDTEENRAQYIPGVPVHSYTVYGVGQFVEGFIELETFKTPYIQPQIAAHITAYARLELIKRLHAEVKRGNIPYYCDTDSLVLENPMEEEFVDPLEYGKWKLENEVEHGIYLQPKMYAEETQDKPVIKGKGIPSAELKKLEFAHYQKWLAEIRKRNGKVAIQVYTGAKRRSKIISAWKNGTSLDIEIPDAKTIDFSKRQKRDIDWTGNKSRPWDFSDIEIPIIERQLVQQEIDKTRTERDLWRQEHRNAPSLWWVVWKKFGGVSQKDVQRFKLPRWMQRKSGKDLDVIVSELKYWNFIFEDGVRLADALIHWEKYRCP